MTDRVFSMSTGLAASTVTPGSTAPLTSRTTPEIALCACAAAGRSTRHPTAVSRVAADLDNDRRRPAPASPDLPDLATLRHIRPPDSAPTVNTDDENECWRARGSG